MAGEFLLKVHYFGQQKLDILTTCYKTDEEILELTIPELRKMFSRRTVMRVIWGIRMERFRRGMEGGIDPIHNPYIGKTHYRRRHPRRRKKVQKVQKKKEINGWTGTIFGVGPVNKDLCVRKKEHSSVVKVAGIFLKKMLADPELGDLWNLSRHTKKILVPKEHKEPFLPDRHHFCCDVMKHPSKKKN